MEDRFVNDLRVSQLIADPQPLLVADDQESLNAQDGGGPQPSQVGTVEDDVAGGGGHVPDDRVLESGTGRSPPATSSSRFPTWDGWVPSPSLALRRF